MRPSPSSRRGGLTLLEIVITTSLLLLIIVPLYGLMYQSRVTVAESKYESLARLGVEGQIERMQEMAASSEDHFARLAKFISDNPTFTVPGVPTWVGGPANGRIRVCLDETRQYFTDTAATDDDYFACARFTQLPYPAYQLDLDASEHASGGTTIFSNLATSSSYRILPVRVEVYWGHQAISGAEAGDMAPKVVDTAVIAPKTKFRRG